MIILSYCKACKLSEKLEKITLELDGLLVASL